MASTLLSLALPLMLVGGPSHPPDTGTGVPNAGSSLGGSDIVAIANWRCPYCNIDRRYDAGNDTGDWMVERLNQAQLDRGPNLYPRPYRYGHRPYPRTYRPYGPPGS